MRILALDTSNLAMSVAVIDAGVVQAEALLNHQKTHSAQLMPTITRLMAQSGLAPSALDRIVVAQGPGSYTGVRIAVTTAKTLADTLGLDLVGISSLAVLAANVTATPDLIVPLMDARRAHVFAGVYQWVDGRLVNVVADRHLPLDHLLAELNLLNQPAVLVGVDVAKYTPAIRAGMRTMPRLVTGLDALPNAGRLAMLGVDAQPVDAATFVPRYLRLTEAETNWLKTHDAKGHAPYVEKV